MAKLTTATRKKLPNSAFALPQARKYPVKKIVSGKLVNDPSHAANAKARATQMVNAGKLSAASKAKIVAKANKVLGKSKKKA